MLTMQFDAKAARIAEGLELALFYRPGALAEARLPTGSAAIRGCEGRVGDAISLRRPPASDWSAAGRRRFGRGGSA